VTPERLLRGYAIGVPTFACRLGLITSTPDIFPGTRNRALALRAPANAAAFCWIRLPFCVRADRGGNAIPWLLWGTLVRLVVTRPPTRAPRASIPLPATFRLPQHYGLGRPFDTLVDPGAFAGVRFPFSGHFGAMKHGMGPSVLAFADGRRRSTTSPIPYRLRFLRHSAPLRPRAQRHGPSGIWIC